MISCSSSLDAIVNFIVELNGYKFTTELTFNNSIFFTIVKDNNVEIHYDFFVEEIGNEKEVLFSLYQNKECLIYGWDNVFNSIERLKKFIQDNYS